MSTHVTASQSHALPAYDDGLEYLADELRKLDRLIALRVAALRLTRQATAGLSTHQHIYITHEEVDWLLAEAGGPPAEPPDNTTLRRRIAELQSDIDARVAATIAQGRFLALVQLARVFGLSPFELQVVIICLAPELQRKYDRLYAYLQDDITRKRPSVDLVLTLLCDSPADQWRSRALLTPQAPLLRAGIVQVLDDPQSPSGSSDLARFLRLDPHILSYLLGHTQIDDTLAGAATLYQPEVALEHVLVESECKAQLLHLVQHHCSAEAADRRELVLYLHGPRGVGRRALALGICGQLRCPLLYVDVEALLGRETNVTTLLRLALREGVLLQAAVYFDNLDRLLGEERQAQASLKAFAKAVAEYGWLTFLAGQQPWWPGGVFEPSLFQSVELPVPDVPLRSAAWRSALEQHLPTADPGLAGQLADRFRLTPGQIRAAARDAAQQAVMRGGQPGVQLDDLYRACRHQSQNRLGELAVKIDPRRTWQDLVLPADTLDQLNELCIQVKHRHRVFGEWGFERKLSHGKGVSVLFSGPPGTGKTLAAEVIAHELAVDLYKVDLSGVVSKYIGETEKNLSKIFHEAENSNAILFFDEADALFGKRTEVSDAHDRYANIETSYLLQKMEEYQGAVILATNLRENMDAAFTRRLRFIVEFPFPDEASRAQIWKTHFPSEAPVSAEVDCALLARKFALAGGSIKNIVLNAAFFAADDGGVIGMEHILRGTRREFEKIGKLWSEPSLPSPCARKG